jgi:hypothetical protein
MDLPTDYANLSRNGAWKLPDDSVLGLGTWGGPILFHSVRVEEIVTVAGTARP